MEHRIPETQISETVTTSITVPRELWNAVKIEAIKRSTSAQQLCIDALTEVVRPSTESAALTDSKEPRTARAANGESVMTDSKKRKSA